MADRCAVVGLDLEHSGPRTESLSDRWDGSSSQIESADKLPKQWRMQRILTPNSQIHWSVVQRKRRCVSSLASLTQPARLEQARPVSVLAQDTTEAPLRIQSTISATPGPAWNNRCPRILVTICADACKRHGMPRPGQACGETPFLILPVAHLTQSTHASKREFECEL